MSTPDPYAKLDIYPDRPPRTRAAIVCIDNMALPFFERVLKFVTGSDLSHVAMVLDGVVYEAAPPCVRKMVWSPWVRNIVYKEWAQTKKSIKQGGLKAYLMEPPPGAVEPGQITAMRRYGELMLGAKYSLVVNWLIGTDAVHCSEFGGVMLNRGGVIAIEGKPNRVTPQMVADGLEDLGWKRQPKA